MSLLTRNEFREQVFDRDNHKCVICQSQAQDAHHIIDRRLWGNGGYYLNNGASLCGECHLDAEKTILSCIEIRDQCNIKKAILPEHLYPDNEYDKWGNIILPNKTRIKGELFYDENVQKVLQPVLHMFTNYVKYPRTYHLPFTASITPDDRILNDCSQFEGREVVVTEKMDGENTTIYQNYIHARSIESDNHISRTWVKNLASKIGWEFPDGWRLCGENLYAKHAIAYEDLKSFFYVFSLWDYRNLCCSWNETLEFCEILDLFTVPVLYRGIWDKSKVKEIAKGLDINKQEGLVVRLTDSFEYGAFRKSVAKYVRKDHVSNIVHNWKRQPVVPNKIVGERREMIS